MKDQGPQLHEEFRAREVDRYWKNMKQWPQVESSQILWAQSVQSHVSSQTGLVNHEKTSIVSQAPNQSSLVASGHHDVFLGVLMFGHAIRVAIQQRPRLASDAESCPCWDHRWPHSEGGRNTSCSWMRRFIFGFNRLPGLCVSSNFGPLLHRPWKPA